MLGERVAESREELGLVSPGREAPQLETVGPRRSWEVHDREVDSHLQEVPDGLEAGALEDRRSVGVLSPVGERQDGVRVKVQSAGAGPLLEPGEQSAADAESLGRRSHADETANLLW
jgi:hypothetical protein